jgi:hypothetical protein
MLSLVNGGIKISDCETLFFEIIFLNDSFFFKGDILTWNGIESFE